jgi:hypothetical protein
MDKVEWFIKSAAARPRSVETAKGFKTPDDTVHLFSTPCVQIVARFKMMEDKKFTDDIWLDWND